MKFFEVLKRRKLLFLNIFLFLYIAMNLFTGDRGLISYFEKKELQITYPGQFSDGSAYFIGGWWRWGAFSNMVPLNYQPNSQENN